MLKTLLEAIRSTNSKKRAEKIIDGLLLSVQEQAEQLESQIDQLEAIELDHEAIQDALTHATKKHEALGELETDLQFLIEDWEV